MGAKALWSGRFVWRRLQKCMIMESGVRESGRERGGEGGQNSLLEQVEHERSMDSILLQNRSNQSFLECRLVKERMKKNGEVTNVRP